MKNHFDRVIVRIDRWRESPPFRLGGANEIRPRRVLRDPFIQPADGKLQAEKIEEEKQKESGIGCRANQNSLLPFLLPDQLYPALSPIFRQQIETRLCRWHLYGDQLRVGCEDSFYRVAKFVKAFRQENAR